MPPPIPWKQIIPYIPTIVGGLGTLFGRKKKPSNQPFYDLYNPLSQFLRSRLGQPMPSYTPLAGTTGAFAQENINRALQGLPSPGFESYFTTVYRDPALKQMQETYLPQTRAAYQGPGTYWGSERAKAEQDIINETARQLGIQRAQSYEADITRGLTYAPQIYSQQYEMWKRTLPEYSPIIDYMVSLLGQTPYQQARIDTTWTDIARLLAELIPKK